MLGQLKNVRAISERNAQGVRETRGATGDLLRHAEALHGRAQRGVAKNGRPASQRSQRPRMSDLSGTGTRRRIGILTTDTELVVKSWDAALERMTGIAADDARGQRLDALVPDLRRARARRTCCASRWSPARRRCSRRRSTSS